MPYIIAFGLILAGYTLLDWGHYVAGGHKVSLWYLISGKTVQETTQTSQGKQWPTNAVGGGAIWPDSVTAATNAVGAITKRFPAPSPTPPPSRPKGRFF